MSTEAHEPVSPICGDPASYWKAAHDRMAEQNLELSRQIDALQKVGEQCLSPQQTTMREAAEAVTKGFSALEVLLAAQDADIPDAEPLWVKVSRRREEIGTYGQLRALRRALNLAHPQQGGERDGEQPEIIQHVKSKGLYEVVTRDAQVQTDTPLSDYAFVCVYRNAITGATWVRPVSEMDDGRFVTVLPNAPTSPSKSSGEEDPIVWTTLPDGRRLCCVGETQEGCVEGQGSAWKAHVFGSLMRDRDGTTKTFTTEIEAIQHVHAEVKASLPKSSGEEA